jgi:predicted ATPase/class 3 adenylate cyclase
MSTEWRIDLLGGLHARSGDRVVSRFYTQKIAALLAFLAYHLEKSHSRDALIDLLWPDADPKAGRNSLSVALSSLRNQLEPPGVPTGAVLIADRASVRLNPQMVSTDVAALRECLATAERAGGRTERVAALEDAVGLYSGELLPGFYEEWVLQEREWLSQQHFQALSQLIAALERAGDVHRALEHARQGVRADPLREEAQRELIRLLVAAGQPEAARRQYAELERLLQEQLGEAPSAETRALLAPLLSQPVGRYADPGGSRQPVGTFAEPTEAVGDTGSSATGYRLPPGSAYRPTGSLPTGTVTFLLSDVERSTAHWELESASFAGVLAEHHALLRRLFLRYGGREVKEMGDGFLVAFERAGDALACAMEGQRALDANAWPAETGPVRVRMALHTGDVEAVENDYHGPVLNRAARILAAGHGGQILCSDATAALLRRDLEPGVRLKDLGVYRLRDVALPERLLQVEFSQMSQQAFPPLRAEAGHAGHLPLSFSRFFGREAEVEQLSKVLLTAEGRLVTLMGPGGSGKTRLALEVARGLVEEWQGAVWFVPLADLVEPERVAEAIRDILRLPHLPQTEPLEQVVEALARQPSLLVLDNFEQLVDEGASLVRRLLEAAPELTCLVTSRRRLNLEGEREFLVPPLPTPDIRYQMSDVSRSQEQNADRTEGRLPPSHLTTEICTLISAFSSVQLFVDRAQAVRPDFQVTERNAGAVATLCQRLEGIPLAIELAASRAQVLTPGQMLERLARRFDLLVSRQRGATRHQSLRATLDWSFELLAPELQRFFARLSVFRGDWTLEAAEAICGETLALDYLAQLRECSLVVAEDGSVEGVGGEEMRFRLLETVREYASEQVTPEERAVLERAHMGYYLALAEEGEPQLAGAEQGEWLERLEREHENLRAALDRSTAASEVETSLRLGAALVRFWEMRGHWQEGLERLTGILALPRADEDTAYRAKALINTGIMACNRGDLSMARALHEEGLALAREEGDRQQVARALNGIATVALHQGELRTARTLFEESLAIRRELGDKLGLSHALNNLGVVTWRLGDREAARAYHEESLQIKQELGDRAGVAISLNSLGLFAQWRGDYREARRLAEESLAIRRELGDRDGAAYSLFALGNIAEEQGDMETARELYAECLGIFRDVGHRDGVRGALQKLGDMAHAAGDDKRAEALYQESLTHSREMGDRKTAAHTMTSLGRLACERNDLVAARALLEESLRIRRELEDMEGVSYALHALGDLTRREGDLPTAAALVRESLTLRRQLGAPPATAGCLESLAAIASEQGEPGRAARLFGAAAALRDTAGTPLPARERAGYEQDLATARGRLSEAEFAAAWAEGQAMAREEAICFAVEESATVPASKQGV